MGLSGAAAASLTIGATLDYAEPVADGFWWQREFPHTLCLYEPGFLVGTSFGSTHIDYIHSGTFQADAIAFSNIALARFVGHGWYHGIRATYEWKWLSLGGFLYEAKWYEDTTQLGIQGHFSNMPNLHIAPVLSLGRSGQHWRVELTEYPMCISNRCKSGVYPPIWRNIHQFGISYKF